ncbi:MAG: hypothetical protein QOF78_2252, partial [Phycisphaerales bacterium]|nr:hypothetical protein [Phycisphaerales bacterium]
MMAGQFRRSHGSRKAMALLALAASAAAPGVAMGD